MTHEWKSGDKFVVTAYQLEHNGIYINHSKGSALFIHDEAITPIDEYLSDMWEWQAKKLLEAQARVTELETFLVEIKPVDDFFDRPQEDLTEVAASLNDGDLVEVRYADSGDGDFRGKGTVGRTNDGTDVWFTHGGKITKYGGHVVGGITHIRVIERAPKPLPEEPPVGTWILTKWGIPWMRGGEGWNNTISSRYTSWSDVIKHHGPVRIFTPGDPIGGTE